jgi:HEAT repeat protein
MSAPDRGVKGGRWGVDACSNGLSGFQSAAPCRDRDGHLFHLSLSAITGIQAALTLAGVTFALTLLMVSAVVNRKLRRDKREWIGAYRNSQLKAGLSSGDPEILRLCVGQLCDDHRAQSGFAAVLDEVFDDLDGAQRAHLAAAVRDTGLAACLLEQLESRDPVKRGYAVLLLSHLRMPEAVRALPDLIHDPDTDVRLAVCAGLARLETDEAARAMISALISRSLASERVIERLGAAWAVPEMIAAISSEEVAVELARGDDPDPAWRASVARALGLAADSRAEPVLLRLLASPDLQERVSAARALGGSGTERCVGRLISCLDDPAWQVQAQAAKALAARGDERAVPELERCLEHRSWWVRANAADALAQLGQAGTASLRRALKSTDRYARDRAVEALATHGLA